MLILIVCMVSALRKIGAKIDFVFKEGYDIGLNIRPDELVYTIVLKQKHKGGFWFRVYLAIVLFKIKKNIDLNKYDKIILHIMMKFLYSLSIFHHRI